MHQPPALPHIDRTLLNQVVGRALHSRTATVSAWQIKPIAHPAINHVSVGVFRVSGLADADGESRPWSLILKIMQLPPPNRAVTGIVRRSGALQLQEARVSGLPVRPAAPYGRAAGCRSASAALGFGFFTHWLPHPLTDETIQVWITRRYGLPAEQVVEQRALLLLRHVLDLADQVRAALSR